MLIGRPQSTYCRLSLIIIYVTMMMRSIFYSLVICIMSITWGQSQGIEFVETRWQDAMEQAKEQDKLLFVDSYAQWCGPCKRMAKYEFVKPEVGEIYNANFVNLKLDMETKNGRTFDSSYPVSAYPTMFFLDGEGNVVKKVRGGKKAEQLIQMAETVLKSFDRSGKYEERYADGDRSYDLMFNYVKALNQAQKPSLKISNDYINSKPDITEEELAAFYHVAVVDADSRIFDKMVGAKDAVIASVGAESYDSKIISAVKNTLDKAVEYESEDLKDEALGKLKHLTKDADAEEARLSLDYHRLMNDEKSYLKSVSDLSKWTMKNDLAGMKQIVTKMHSDYPKSEEVQKTAVSLSKKYFKKAKNVSSTEVYAKSLTMIKDYAGALDVVKKGIKYAEKSGEETRSLEMMTKYIEARM